MDIESQLASSHQNNLVLGQIKKSSSRPTLTGSHVTRRSKQQRLSTEKKQIETVSINIFDNQIGVISKTKQSIVPKPTLFSTVK